MGYLSHTLRGVSWMSALRFVTRIASFAKIAILARLLSPSQFGIFGIASLVLALLEILTETGINVYIVQSQRPIKEYISSAWVVSIIRGFVIGLLIIMAAPFVAHFFKTSSALPVLFLIAIVPIFRGFINPAVATLQKDLRFNFEFWYRTGIFLFDAIITVFLAIFTRSVYSLIFGMIAGTVLELILSFILITPRPTLRLEKGYFKELFRSGKWVTLYGIFHYIAQEGDDIVVGRLLGPASLGIYQLSYKVAILPISEVTDVVSRVTFPVFTQLRFSTKNRLFSAFFKTTAAIAIFSTLIGGVIFVFPKEIILFLLGEKWLTAVSVLEILAIYGVIRAISGSVSALFLGIEKQKYVTAMVFTRCIALGVTIYPLVSYFGLLGAAYAALISVIIEIPVVLYFLFLTRQINTHPKIVLSGKNFDNG